MPALDWMEHWTVSGSRGGARYGGRGGPLRPCRVVLQHLRRTQGTRVDRGLVEAAVEVAAGEDRRVADLEGSRVVRQRARSAEQAKRAPEPLPSGEFAPDSVPPAPAAPQPQLPASAKPEPSGGSGGGEFSP